MHKHHEDPTVRHFAEQVMAQELISPAKPARKPIPFHRKKIMQKWELASKNTKPMATQHGRTISNLYHKLPRQIQKLIPA